MAKLERKENMRNAVTHLAELMTSEILGPYTWFEATEVFAICPPTVPGENIIRNVFSLYVAESGSLPSVAGDDEVYLSPALETLRSVGGWKFGVVRRHMSAEDLYLSIRRYGRDSVWQLRNHDPLHVGDLVAEPPMFCAPTSFNTPH